MDQDFRYEIVMDRRYGLPMNQVVVSVYEVLRGSGRREVLLPSLGLN